jgi:biopolymer transport protein ExbD
VLTARASLNLIVRFPMRLSSIFILLLIFAVEVCAQEVSDAQVSVDRTIRISADGSCHVAKVVAPCDQLGARMRSMRIAQGNRLYIEVGPESKYDVLHTILESLSEAGYSDVGFVRRASGE